MHVGRSYSVKEFIIWTRRRTYKLLLLGIIPVIVYEVIGWKWVSIPWTVVALLGTATAFIIGFKNTQSYNRTVDAHQVWSTIITSSRSWAIMCRDFIKDEVLMRRLIDRHIGWLTALRFQLREERIWETTNKRHNLEYSQTYSIPEKESSLLLELNKYVDEEELANIAGKSNIATQLQSIQSRELTEYFNDDPAGMSKYLELVKSVKEFYVLQGRAERIKDTPYPRQYAVINTFFVKLFCLLLPYGMLKQFDELNSVADGLMNGYMIWLVIPFSIIISWMYISLEQVGESTENPFEGGANDVPISQLSRMIEIEMLEIIQETDLPERIGVRNNIAI